MTEILSSPDKLVFYLAIQAAIGEGHAQYTDDMFTTHDGRLLAVSRPSFADVVGIDLASGQIAWRFPMEGYRSDHMGVSPDGERLLVSDSTANKVHELDIRTGAKTGEFPSGDSPHENNYTADGERVFHGWIEFDTQAPDLDGTSGYEGEPAVGAVTRVVDLPNRTTEPRENYLLDSAHHGMAMNREGTTMCAAGTMDGYAAIIDRETGEYRLVEVGEKPYWSTNGVYRDECWSR